MAATAFVRARIDETLKNEAAAVLAELGLTVSDVVRMTLTRVAKDHALPFELKVPNAETRGDRGIPRRDEGSPRPFQRPAGIVRVDRRLPGRALSGCVLSLLCYDGAANDIAPGYADPHAYILRSKAAFRNRLAVHVIV